MLLKPAPRTVSPLTLAIVLSGSKRSALIWGVLIFFSLIFWLMHADTLKEYVEFQQPLRHTQGRVLNVEDANAEEMGGDIYRHTFQYQIGRENYIGTSYATTALMRNEG